MTDEIDPACLVTGATGLIGRRVVDRLCKKGHSVLAVGRAPNAFEGRTNVTYRPLDLQDPAAVTAFMEHYKPRQMIHLAWEATPGTFWQSPENFRWIAASAHLLDRFVAEGGERAILTGSCAEYDWNQTPQKTHSSHSPKSPHSSQNSQSPYSFQGALHETESPLNPRSYYSASKTAFHDLARVIARDIELVWARVFFPYGPEEDSSKLISHILREIGADRLPDFKTPGRAVDFIHLSDVAFCFERLLAASVTGPVNICSGVALRPPEIAAAAARLLNKPDLAATLEAQLASIDDELTIVGDRQLLDQVLTQTGQTPPSRLLSMDDGLRSYLRSES
jgi:nucleoside-diphosphate-sugar epimerase